MRYKTADAHVTVLLHFSTCLWKWVSQCSSNGRGIVTRSSMFLRFTFSEVSQSCCCSSRLASMASNGLFFAQLDRPILDMIVQCLATSPSQKANGIACCNRRCNVAWRRMHWALVRKLLKSALDDDFFVTDRGVARILIEDISDIIGE